MGMFDSPASFDAKILRQAKRRHRRASPQRVVRACKRRCPRESPAGRLFTVRRRAAGAMMDGPPSLDPKWYFETDDCGRRVARSSAVRGTKPYASSGQSRIQQTYKHFEVAKSTTKLPQNEEKYA